ncbi:MAG: tetratricopeptide repeat protein [Alphaproteobacteria bacterium]|nr:tetratricopeptide repeat protein [Alphaproteobacteria bacterium]MCB9791510.1 tetratricopeptide repeat protein [Alphaproteobacteria bacterium]
MSGASLRSQAWQLKQQGRYAEALALLSPAAAAAREAEDLLVAMELTDDEANLLMQAGEGEAALARATWAIGVAADPDRGPALASDRGARAVARAYRTWASAAMSGEQVPLDHIWPVLDAFEDTLRRLDRAAWSWNVDHLRSTLHRHQGQHAEAVPCFVRAIEGYLRAPEAPGVTLGSIRRGLSWSLRRLGRHDEAIEQLQRVIQDPEVDRFDLVTAQIYLAQTLWHAGRAPEAAEASDRAVEGAESLGRPQQLAAWGTAVEAWLGVGRLEDASRGAARVVAMAQESGRADDLFGAHQDSFDVAMARGERDAAAAHLEAMARYLTRIERQGRDSYWRQALQARRARLEAE